PRNVFVVGDLPLTITGKFLKRELRDWVAGVGTPTEAAGTAAVTAARTPTEAAVVAVWEEVLDRRPIGVDDDFFDHGGHSLAAAQIVARVNDVFGIDLPVTAVFDASTAAEVAALVDRARAVEGAG
ncbi:MAG: phosphopantetheine-binding protein, partial [Acidimicrobiales bacterium]